MEIVQKIWLAVPGDGLGDKLAVISLCFAVLAGGLAVVKRWRKRDVESLVGSIGEKQAELSAEVKELRDLLIAQANAKMQSSGIATGVGQGSDVFVNDLSAAVTTLAEEGKMHTLHIMQAGDTSAAEAALMSKIAKIEATRVEATRQEAALYRQLGALAFLHDTQAALGHYAKATELDPDDTGGWTCLASLQRHASTATT